MYSNILSEIKTKEEANTLSEEIDLLRSSLYEGNDQSKSGGNAESFSQTLSSNIRKNISKAISEDLKQSTVSLEQFLDDLQKTIENLPVLTLTLAFEPTGETAIKITNWTSNNLGDKVIIDFDFDKRIVGGAIISYQGQYRDFSLKKAITKSFETNNEEYWKIVMEDR